MAKVSYNRLANLGNKYQGPSKRVLCVCSAGMLRSPTVAWVLSNPPFNFNTRAVGASDYALIPLDEALVQWADEVICMDNSQKRIIEELDASSNTPIYVSNIPDEYPFRDPELVKIVTEYCLDLFDMKEPVDETPQ